MNEQQKRDVQAAAQLLAEQLDAAKQAIPESLQKLLDFTPVSQPETTETAKSNDKPAQDDAPMYASKAEMLKAKKCPFEYDEASDTFKMNLEMRVGAGAPGTADMEQIQELMKATWGTKAGNAPNFEPTDEEFAKIQSFAAKTVQKSDFKVYYVTAATNQVDRHFEKFSTKALEAMAALAVDQPFIKDHNCYNSDGVLGKIFDAKVASKDGGKFLFLKVYMHKTAAKQAVFDGIESGENNKVSISASFKNKDLVCDVCNKGVYDWSLGRDMCRHMPGQELEDGTTVTATYKDMRDFRECSRVTTPAQKPAAIKGMDAGTGVNKSDESTMSPEQIAAKAEALLSQLNQSPQTETAAAPTDSTQKSTVKHETTIPEVNKSGVTVVDELEKLIAALGANSESFSKAVEEIGVTLKSDAEARETFKATADALKASCDSLKDVAEKLQNNVEASQKSLAAREEQFSKEIEANKQLVKAAIQLQLDLAKSCNLIAGKSIDDLAIKVMSHIELQADKAKNAAASNTASDKDAGLKGQEGGSVYESVVTRMSNNK